MEGYLILGRGILAKVTELHAAEWLKAPAADYGVVHSVDYLLISDVFI
jgi:hypothetical protein